MRTGKPARPIRVEVEGESYAGYVVHEHKTVFLAYCDVAGRNVEAKAGSEAGAIAALKEAVRRELDWP